MKEFIKEFLKNKLIYYFIALTVPLILVLIGYKNLEISPFGENSLLSMDLWGQYMPMFKEQYVRNREFLSKLYSWNGALGFNFYSQSAYYCNSIFNFIFLLFDSSKLIDVLDYIILLKFGLSSVTFLIFLDYKFKNINLLASAVSIAYGLCAYNIAFLNQPMWTDIVIFLPIVIIGLDRLIFENKPIFYCISLALVIFSNFYISFSVCIFSVIYFAAELIILKSELSKKKFLEKIKIFLLYSFLAGCLAGFIILPVYDSILLRAESSNTISEIRFYHSIPENIYALFPFSKLAHEFQVPNIYSGIFIIPGIILFVLNKEISLKRKITFLSIVFFMFLSINLNMLDFVWHGFHFPNQLPGRWTFIFSFVVLLISYEAIYKSDKIYFFDILISVIISITLIGIGTMSSEAKTVDIDFIAKIILLITVYNSLIFLASIFKQKSDKVKNTKIKKKRILIKNITVIFLGIIMTSEILISSYAVIERDVGVSDLEQFQFLDEIMAEAVSKYENDENNFYRMDMNSNWTFNPGQLYNYKGISYYSSTMTGNTYNLLKSLGYRVYANNVSSVFKPDSPVMNSAFAIKYIIDRNKNFKNTAFELEEENEKYDVYKNKYYLPIGFAVNAKILDWLKNPISPLQNHNDFIKLALNDDNIEIFKKMPNLKETFSNVSIDDTNNWYERYYHRIENDKPVSFKYSFTCEEEGQYFIQQNFKKGDLIIDSPQGNQEFSAPSEPFKCIGIFDKGDVINISLEVDNVDIGLYGIEFYKFDEKNFASAIDILNKETLNVTTAADTEIKGTIDVKENGKVLYTSIPDDGGWNIKCDGEKAQIKKIGNNLIGIDIPIGKHEIEFNYSVPGLKLGICLSVISILAIIALCFIKRQKENKIKLNKKSV